MAIGRSARKHWLLSILAVLLVLVIALYVAAPMLVKRYLNNEVLNDLGDYRGHLGDLEFSLLRGSYLAQNLVIVRKGGREDVPFVKVPEAEASLDMRALLKGEVALSGKILEPELNFLDADKPEDRQSGAGTDWFQVLDEAVPITVESLEVVDGAVKFQNLDSEPKVDVAVTDIDITVENLTNVKDENGERVATLAVTGKLYGESPLQADARFDPFDFQDFNFASQVEDVVLRRTNDFAKVYANLDFNSGQGDIFAELKATDGKLTGYVKPLFTDVDILSWEQDVEREGDNPLRLLWEGVTGFVKTLFTNEETDRVATEIPIEGDLTQAEIDTWAAATGVIKNAFVDAVEANFEQLTPLTQPERNTDEEDDQSS